MTPNARRNLIFLWSIGDRAVAASLGRTLIPVFSAPSQRINSAIKQAVRAEGGCSFRAVGRGGGGRGLCAHGALRVHDPQVGAGRCSQAETALGQPGPTGPRPRACQRPAAGDAGMDRAELGRFLSWATPTIRTSPWAGGCSRPPGPLHGHCSRADRRREASRGYHEGLGGLVSKPPRAPDRQDTRVAVSGRRVGT